MRRVRWPAAVLLVEVTVVIAAVVVVGLNTPIRRAGTAGVALGPSSGQQVDAYLSHAAVLPAAGGPYWALVSLRTELTPTAAAAIPGPARLARVVLQVPIARVQTPQLSIDVADQGDRAAELHEAMALAADQLQRIPAADNRAAAVARISAARLRRDCACVLAMLVRGSGEELQTIAAESQVRAVQAAPPGTELCALSVVPLLPEQATVVGPTPDDGAVPPA